MNKILISLILIFLIAGCSINEQDQQHSVENTVDNNISQSTDNLQSVTQEESPLDNSSIGQEEKDSAMTPPDITPPPGLENLIELAKNDLADRLKIEANDIQLVKAIEITWPDASLGCPQPDMAYKQVPEDGAQIILKDGDLLYSYHYGSSRGLFLCELTLNSSLKPTQIDLSDYLTPPAPDNSIPPGEDE